VSKVDECPVGWQVSPSARKMEYLDAWATGETALDLGCGRGWYASALAERGFRVAAMDAVRQVDDERIELTVGPIEPPLPYPDAAFDTVLMFDILEHLDDEAAILGEVARVTRGRLIVSVPHADDAFLPHYGLTYLHRVDKTHRREYTPDDLCARLEAHGFRTLHVALEGLPHIPLVFAEFVRGGRAMRQVAKYAIVALYKLGLIVNKRVAGDIFWVGERVAGHADGR
jgi:SAM-dependent methyltransferase